MQNLCVLYRHTTVLAERVEWGHFWIQKGLRAVEVLVAKSGGKYCVGDEITMADCCLIPQVFNATVRFAVDMEQFPNINRIVRNLELIDAVSSARPQNQPDKQ
jgi:maleylacetoacetate isomerase